MVRVLHFIAIILTALVLIPGSAHLFELPHKIGLDADQYLTIQQIYAGWAFFGFPFFAALIADVVLAILTHGSGRFWPIGYAAAATAAALAVFLIWTLPANQQTANWTHLPADWQVLRIQWEYSHAAGALPNFTGLCALVLAALLHARRPV